MIGGTGQIRVLLADDQPLIRAGLVMVITDAPDIEVVGQAGSGAEALRLVHGLRPDVVVMDIRMPGLDGIEATRRIRAEAPGTRVLMLTTFDDDENVYGSLRAGASGFLLKDMALEDILAAVRVVAAGDALIAPSVTRRLIADFTDRDAAPARDPRAGSRARARLAGVTEREHEVLALVARGLANSEIAAELVISLATAKTHVANLLTKLDARDRIQLVILAYEAGIVG
ncbi:response regulator transcription factor [Catenulispora pinisilvae]|uniref:response regulator transcription factor n=1 Tax=Catenulispora pinisilvae TaxID=2705253 RepID=UPI002B2704A9|nr:response regulator transcription factor [Catenulispora pinisilvae]